MKNAFYCFIPLLGICLLLGCRQGRDGSGRDNKPSVETTESDESVAKPVVNVYIENSGSMDGYVNGDTEFKQAVFGYLGKIKMSGLTDTLNLFYINSIILPQGIVIKDSNAVVMQDFVQKLNPTRFKEKGGNRGASDIANVIRNVLSDTQQNEIAILVTDGIFSPGKADAANFLSIQQTGIGVTVDEYLDKYPNTAVIVYQLFSNFNGIFFNKLDEKFQINEPRPYYIYVFGDAKYLSNLRKKAPDNDFKGGGVKNVFSIVSGNKQVRYAINQSIGKHGNTKDKNTIVGLGKDKSKKVRFAINVDFSDMLLDDSYLKDSSNYENNSKYNLDIKPVLNKNSNYTHTLYFSSDKVHPKGEVTVKLKAQRPGWIDEVNDDDGSFVAAGKTYGIKYQIDGIFDAFTFENKYYTDIKINIK